MEGLSTYSMLPTLLSTFRNPYFLCVDVGSIVLRLMDVFARHAFPKGQIELIGLVNPHRKWVVMPTDNVPDLDWVGSWPPDRCYFVFALDGADSPVPADLTQHTLDLYARVWTGTVSGHETRYLVIGVRQQALLAASPTTMGCVFVALRAFTDNWRTRRLKYSRNAMRFHELYQNTPLNVLQQRLFNMPLLKCIEQVPYPLWFFVRDVWVRWPNVLSARMLSMFTATYYTLHLTDAAQAGLAVGGLHRAVYNMLSGNSDAGTGDSLGEYLALSAYTAKYEELQDASGFLFNDCERLNTASWPLLYPNESEQDFSARRTRLLEVGLALD